MTDRQICGPTNLSSDGDLVAGVNSFGATGIIAHTLLRHMEASEKMFISVPTL